MAIISSIPVLKANVSAVELNVNFASISSYIDDVERDIIADAIGADAVAYFAAHLTDNLATTNPIFGQALTLITRSEAYLSLLRWSELSMYRFTDQALYLAKCDKGVPLSDKKTRDLKNFLEEEGFNFLDKLIGYMEANIGLFTAYQGSDNRQLVKQCFVGNAQAFNLQRNIRRSRLTYMAMLPILLEVQNDMLPPVMGQAYYTAYLAAYAAGTLSNTDLKLMPFIQKAIVLLAMGRATKELPFIFSSKGILINKYSETREYDSKDPAGAAQLEFLGDQYIEKGEQKLTDLKNYLITNASSYPSYVPPATNNGCFDRCSGLYEM